MNKSIKSTLFIAIAALSCTWANAQSIERQVIGSCGGSFSGGFQVDWTAGETVTATASGGSTILTQGFQQPPQAVNAVKTVVTSGLLAFPNPTNNLVTVEWKDQIFSGSLSVFDASGREVMNKKLSAVSNYQLDLTTMAPGVYNLKLLGEDRKISIVRITKI